MKEDVLWKAFIEDIAYDLVTEKAYDNECTTMCWHAKGLKNYKEAIND